MSIGKNIKMHRKENNLTQKELAEKANISRSYLADVENDRYNPSLDVLNSIANSLNLKTKDLLDDETTDAHINFSTPEDAMRFILEQPAIMGFGGFDINKMSDDEVVEFANELLRQLRLLSYKYKR